MKYIVKCCILHIAYIFNMYIYDVDLGLHESVITCVNKTSDSYIYM